ncbi:MAG: hypothetical protein WBW81_06750 [Methylocella sp.]
MTTTPQNLFSKVDNCPYSGFITGLHAEDQLLSVSPDDSEYLVQANIDGKIQYRFVYISPTRIDDAIDIRLSYVNNKATPAPDGEGVPTLLILFKLKPGQAHYKFVVDPTNGAMVVPVDWKPS